VLSIFLATGEWPISNIGFGLVFLIACLGTAALGWYVVRADALNRAAEKHDE